MNSRGQAALEYLMTYGWALIVIAIVVGVLVFIVATPTGAVACNSNQPGKVNVVSNNIVSTTGLGSLVITNLTGGEMRNMSIVTGGIYATILQVPVTGFGIDSADVTDAMTIGDHVLKIDALGITPVGTTAGSFEFTYDDPAGLTQTVTVSCQNLAYSP